MSKYQPIGGVNIRMYVSNLKQITSGECVITIYNADTGAHKALKADRHGNDVVLNPFKADATGQWGVYTSPGPITISISKGTSTALIQHVVPMDVTMMHESYGPLPIAAEVGPPVVDYVAGYVPDFVGQDYYNNQSETLWKAIGLTQDDWIQIQTVAN